MSWPGQPRTVDHDGPGARGPAVWPYNAEVCERHNKLKVFHQSTRAIVSLSFKLKQKERKLSRLQKEVTEVREKLTKRTNQAYEEWQQARFSAGPALGVDRL